MRNAWFTMLTVALVAGTAGCAREAESAPEAGGAQGLAVVPADLQVAGERADKARIKGLENAPVKIVEISDFQCPYCRQFHNATLRQVDSAYIQTGKVSYLWIAYPSPGHGRAWVSAAAGFCAGAAGQFWPMHDILFDRQEEWSAAPDPAAMFTEYAEEIGVDPASFGSCVRNGLLAPLLLRDFASVNRAGIQSTPYFILQDSVAIRGAADFATFSSAIDTLLALRANAEDDAN